MERVGSETEMNGTLLLYCQDKADIFTIEVSEDTIQSFAFRIPPFLEYNSRRYISAVSFASLLFFTVIGILKAFIVIFISVQFICGNFCSLPIICSILSLAFACEWRWKLFLHSISSHRNHRRFWTYPWSKECIFVNNLESPCPIN